MSSMLISGVLDCANHCHANPGFLEAGPAQLNLCGRSIRLRACLEAWCRPCPIVCLTLCFFVVVYLPIIMSNCCLACLFFFRSQSS